VKTKVTVHKMLLVPPHPSKCRECAAEHDPGEPHDKLSLYYQYRFRGKHGRWPTWDDAMAHCAPEMKETWMEVMREMGIKPDSKTKVKHGCK